MNVCLHGVCEYIFVCMSVLVFCCYNKIPEPGYCIWDRHLFDLGFWRLGS